MVKDIIITLRDGSKCKMIPKELKFVEDLEKWFKEHGIPEKDIPIYLAKLTRPHIESSR